MKIPSLCSFPNNFQEDPRMAHSARLSLDLYTESYKIPRSHLIRTEMKVPLGKGSFSHGLGTFCKVPLRNLKNSSQPSQNSGQNFVRTFFLGRYPHCSSNYQKGPLFKRTELTGIRQVSSIFEDMWLYCTNPDSEHLVCH